MDFLSNIHAKRSILTKSELKVCDLLLDNLHSVQEKSLTELADLIGVSKPTILRFCQKLGFGGYNEFKYECVKYVNGQQKTLSSQDNTQNDISKVINRYQEIFNLIPKFVSEDQLLKFVEQIKKAKHVRIIGAINSSLSAKQLYYALLMFGIDTSVHDSVEELRTIDMLNLTEDLFVIFSVSAHTQLVKYAFQLAESSNVKTILITMNPDAELNKEANVSIVLPSITNLKSQSLLDGVPVFTIFNEIIFYYINR